jgi:ssDNA-binding Zn-finger/Zn-ribbon topoisomerase 1
MTEQFQAAERELMKRYRHLAIAKGSLRMGRGKLANKRVVDVTCPKCKKRVARATSDLWTFAGCAKCRPALVAKKGG